MQKVYPAEVQTLLGALSRLHRKMLAMRNIFQCSGADCVCEHPLRAKAGGPAGWSPEPTACAGGRGEHGREDGLSSAQVPGGSVGTVLPANLQPPASLRALGGPGESQSSLGGGEEKVQFSVWQLLDFHNGQLSAVGASVRDGAPQLMALRSPPGSCLRGGSFCCGPVCAKARSSARQGRVSL